MIRKERLNELKNAIAKLASHAEEFSCNAVLDEVGVEEHYSYAHAMGRPYAKGGVRPIKLIDIINLYPDYGSLSCSSTTFAKVMDFRVWLVAMYYGYVASGAQEEAEG